MKNLIIITLVVAIVIIVMIKALPIEKERKRRLRVYWDRACTGIAWRRRFPDVPKEDIRKFLDAFVDGFAFKTSQRLKFVPDDKVMDVYRSLIWLKKCQPGTPLLFSDIQRNLFFGGKEDRNRRVFASEQGERFTRMQCMLKFVDYSDRSGLPHFLSSPRL